ncbi:hypothetical protein EDD22DRAFT_852173 [Suillus occidentalis]|nr:hypothetical protein EDD22DRAFT_852173 [Suillus occidentalis]
MGRPKLYKTTEELQEAKQVQRRVYYSRHKNKISTKMKARYRVQKKNRLITYLGGVPHKTLNTLYTGYLETCCLDDIRDAMNIIQEILQELKEIEDSMSGGRATDRRYTDAQDDTKQAADVISALKDLFSCVMIQDMDLRQHTSQLQCKALGTSNNINMAPCKWTTSKQEVWLELWYQKFAEKQSDKSRNHKNFFADLYEKWFEEFPEPRPDHASDLGPITLEEHNNAINIRKAISLVEIKLHTRFKNNFSGLKVGRQAKANANDVFDAVVCKITECKKPMQMLQEKEAYSKLYYADRVQKSIQETLKVAQATQSPTNGQRVALVKKETAALYAGESEEVKAKVKEYIHVQKEERGKEKAEPWSDKDQQCLLIGGPSIELGGMIDVWSRFTHPTAHLPGNAEELNSNRSNALPASSMAEDSTEDSHSPSHTSTLCPSFIPSHLSTSAEGLRHSSIPSHPSTLAEDPHPSFIPSHTSTLAKTENEAQNDKGNDSGRLRRTRHAHIPSTRNIIANLIGNNCKENVSKQKDQGYELNTIYCSVSHACFLWYKKQVHRQILSPAADPIKENGGWQGVNGGELPNIHIEHSTPVKKQFDISWIHPVGQWMTIEDIMGWGLICLVPLRRPDLRIMILLRCLTIADNRRTEENCMHELNN